MNLFRCNNAKKSRGSRLLVDDKLSRMLNYSLRMEYKDSRYNLFSNGSLGGQEVVNLFAEGGLWNEKDCVDWCRGGHGCCLGAYMQKAGGAR